MNENLFDVMQRVKVHLEQLAADTALMSRKLAAARNELFGGNVGTGVNASAPAVAGNPTPPNHQTPTQSGPQTDISDAAARLAKVSRSLAMRPRGQHVVAQ